MIEETFRRIYGAAPGLVVRAPGRVNLIGEHTDYNDGFVLPAAIDRFVAFAGRRRADRVVRVHSTDFQDSTEFSLDAIEKDPAHRWSNYLRGVSKFLEADGHRLPGAEIVFGGNVPRESGLSSSAAVEVGTTVFWQRMAGLKLDPVCVAKLARRAENEFVGVPCGIMDQFIVSQGRTDHLLLLDCRSLEHRLVRFDDPTVTVLITNCGVAHELGKGEYAKRRAQCERAAAILGVKSLRDATFDQLRAHAAKLDDGELRRARHVVGEILRTLDFAAAVEAKDWPRAGQHMYASHASLRDDYEVSCAELDTLVEIAREIGEAGGVYGARLTGGGFGGCTVTLVRTEKAESVQDAISREYLSRTGITARMFVSRPAQGAMRLL
jgi:galactokinase